MESPNPFLQILPLLIWSFFFAIIAYNIAKRKADNRIVWTILCALPLIGPVALIFLVSRTDKAVLRELEALRKIVAANEVSNSDLSSS